MKKILLLSIVLCFGYFAMAQNNYHLKPGANVINIKTEMQKSMTPGPENSNPATVSKAKNPFISAPDDIKIVTIVNIGSAANAFGYGYNNGSATFTWYNKDINTVSNLHRMGGVVGPAGQSSSDLAYDFSTDGGMIWTNQVKVYTSDLPGGPNGNWDAARYPQGAIYNPPGNADPDNGYMAYFACNLDASNGGQWGGYSYGVGRFGDPLDTTKHLLSSDTNANYRQGVPTAFHITQVDGNAWMADASLLNSYTTYMGDIIFMKGVFNEGIGDYEYDRFLIPADCSYARYLKMAFDPTGQVGFVYWNDVNGSIPAMEDWVYPLMIKTTDGGETWSDVISVTLGGVDGIYGIKYWLPDTTIAKYFDPVPTRDEMMYCTPYFNSDVAVDAWGNPHLATTVFVAGPGFALGEILVNEETFGVFDIYSIDDDNTNWQAVHLGTLKTYTGSFLYPGSTALTEYNRAQVAATTDGTKMFFTWLDTRVPNVTTNVSPDIYARGFDLFDNKITNDETSSAWDGATNVTSFSEAMWQAFFQSTSYYVMDDGDEGSKVYTVPMVYEQMNPQDVTQPVQFKYIQDFSFADGDFVMETGNDPISPVGLNEHVTDRIASVSQNYPNPFNHTSTVLVSLTEASDLSLVVTNMLGQKMIELKRGPVSAGSYSFIIDGTNLKNGVYFYTVYAGDSKVTRKMIIE